MNGDKVVPHLAQVCSEARDDPLVRWTLVTSLRYTMVAGAPTEVLEAHIGTFFSLLRDEDLAVRRAALQTLNATAHHQPGLVRSVLVSADIMSTLFSEMAVKPHLKRKVDLGPFKHTVDDGLPLRKAAFACMATILEGIPDAVPVNEFMEPLSSGLSDVED